MMRDLTVAVIGAGRVGLTLARALSHRGAAVAVLGRHAEVLPEPLGLVSTNWNPALSAADLILICVPDAAIGQVAARLIHDGAIHETQVVLHTAGRLDRTVLAALEPSGASLGSLHPLQTLADPDGEPHALQDVPAIVEGDPRAVAMARDLAERLGMGPVHEISSEGKARYHAAAVFAANYVVVLADIAGRLALGAGLETTAGLFTPLLARTVHNLGSGDPAAALTGPIRRGDAETVAAHLAVLDPETRELYRRLGVEAIKLAERAGLPPDKVALLRQVLA
jgi:predicted short-subunit dehydrogenase-like oxidoreductase (DUF2520 family)